MYVTIAVVLRVGAGQPVRCGGGGAAAGRGGRGGAAVRAAARGARARARERRRAHAVRARHGGRAEVPDRVLFERCCSSASDRLTSWYESGALMDFSI